MKVQLSELKEKVTQWVQQLWYDWGQAEAIIDTLLYAQMRWNNQGIVKIATGWVPKMSDVEEFKIVKENKCGVMISGGHSMYASTKAADIAVDLAEKHGVGIVWSNHTYSSSGAIGWFARMIAQKWYIGLIFVWNGDFSVVAPYGSSEGKFGTNPFAYAIPYDSGEVVFDNATAAMAFFGIIEAKLKWETLPEWVGFDKDGNPSTDPASVLDGAIATFAEHKWYALSVLVQTLAGPLVGAGTPGISEANGAGSFTIAIDPGLLVEKDKFIEHTSNMYRSIKQAMPLPGKKVYLPWEQWDEIAAQVEKTGEIEIADSIWNELCDFLK